MSEPVRTEQTTTETPLPTLAVIVVNWNGLQYLNDCFRSLQDSRYPDLRVIMVDNGSADESIAWTRSHYPEVEIIDAGSNLRWAEGNNLALRKLAAEDYPGCILLLNNDTFVPQGSLGRLVEGLLQTPGAWAATPRICYADDPARAWYDGGMVGNWSGWIRHHGIRKLTGRLGSDNRLVGYGTGCALLIKPRVLRQVGELDSAFHFYAEDADYCLRIRQAGGLIVHVPRSLVLHKVSASVGHHSSRKAWMRSRSHIRLLRKHWPMWKWPILAMTQAAFLSAHSAWHLWNGRLNTALAVWEGALAELQGQPYENR